MSQTVLQWQFKHAQHACLPLKSRMAAPEKSLGYAL